MYFPKPYFSPFILLSLIFMTGNLLVADEVLFEKQLPDGQKIIVSRKPAPYVPPTKEEIDELREMLGEAFADLAPFEPRPTYECTLALISSNRKQERKLWLLRYVDPEFADDRVPVKFFDANFTSDTLLIVFKASGQLLAEVVKYEPGDGIKSCGDPRRLSKEPGTSTDGHSIFDVRFESAKIEGSFEDDSIAVNLKLTDGKSSKWVLKKNEWTEVPASLLDKPAPPGLKKTE